MFISIIVGIIAVYVIAAILGSVVWGILEIVSFIVKTGFGGTLALMIAQALSFEFTNPWSKMAYFILAGIFISGLITLLSAEFRLICYSINYFWDCFVVCVIVVFLKNSTSVSFMIYVITLFILPRIMWAVDRFTIDTEYQYSKRSFGDDVETVVYKITDVDLWKDSKDSWRMIPFQIVIASVFYTIGSFIFLGVCPIEPDWLNVLFALATTAINIVFDLFVFRKIDTMLTGKISDYIDSFPTDEELF